MTTDEQTEPTPIRRSGRLKAILLGGTILVCGMLIGAGLTLHLLRTNIQHLLQEPERLPGVIAQRLDTVLDLSEAQRTEIEAILDARIRALDAIRQETNPRVQIEIDAIREEVAAVLSPEQAAAWRERFDTLRERWRPEFIGTESSN